MVHTVQILHKLLPLALVYAVPDLLEDELMAVGDDTGNERRVEERDVVFFVSERGTLAEGSCCLLDFDESGLFFEVDAVGDDEALSVVEDGFGLLQVGARIIFQAAD